MILFSIALIQLLHTPAWEFPAGKAKRIIIPIQFLTMPDAAIHTVMRLLCILTMASGAFILIPLISQTKCAIYAAGSDKQS